MTRTIVSGLIMGLLGASSPSAQAAPDGPDADTTDIPTIVVVATRSPRPVNDIAASVTVIDADRAADELAIAPPDLVRYQPGISVPRSSTRFGAGSYTIRGIGGNRVAIEIDGVPIADQFDIGSYSNAERDLVDVALIDRVEILRGPASTLYGSDAIGGVVAYTTLDPDQFGPETYRLRSGYRSDDDSLSNGLAGAWTHGDLGALFSFTQRDGGQLDAGARVGDADRRDYRSRSLFAKVNWDTTNAARVTGTVDLFERSVDSDIRSVLGSGRFRSTTLLTGDDAQQRDRFSLALDAETGSPWAERFQVLGYRQRSDTVQWTVEERAAADLRRTRRFAYEQLTTGLEVNLQAGFRAADWDHRLGYGLEFLRSKVTESRDGVQTDLLGNDPTHNMLGEQFPVRDFPISRISEAGLYVHDEIRRAGGRWTFIPALRFDHYELDPSADALYLANVPGHDVVGLNERRWSPKLGVLFDLTQRNSLFAQYARGFRAPPFEDANIGLDIPLFNIRALPNPDLRAETSDTLELGWRWQGTSGALSITGHYTDYQDFIETKVRLGPDPATGVLLFQSQNVQAAHIYGAELSWQQELVNVPPHVEGLSFALAVAWTEGKNDRTNEALASVGPAEMTAALRWQPDRWPVNLRLHGTFVEAAHALTDGAASFRPRGYAVFDLLANLRLGNAATLRAGIFNLTDKRYWRWQDVRGLDRDDPLIPQLSAPGRNAGVSISFAW